jgi:hypothetical protein
MCCMWRSVTTNFTKGLPDSTERIIELPDSSQRRQMVCYSVPIRAVKEGYHEEMASGVARWLEIAKDATRLGCGCACPTWGLCCQGAYPVSTTYLLQPPTRTTLLHLQNIPVNHLSFNSIRPLLTIVPVPVSPAALIVLPRKFIPISPRLDTFRDCRPVPPQALPSAIAPIGTFRTRLAVAKR